MKVRLSATTTDPQFCCREAQLTRWLRGRLPEAQLSLYIIGNWRGRRATSCPARASPHYRDDSVYDSYGVEVTYWSFHHTISMSFNLFGDGTISSEHLLADVSRR